MAAPLTLAQLRAEFTLETATSELIAQLDALGFEATSWQEGSVQRTMVVIMAFVYWKLREYVATLTYICFNSTSEGEALTEFSRSHYANERITSTAARHNCVLTGAAVGPPHSFDIDELVATNGSLLFRVKEAGTIGASTTLPVVFEAAAPGSDGNVAINTITSLVTPLAGVTITNPDQGDGTSIETLGADAETDPSLRSRNESKWSTLSDIEAISDRYEHVARNVVANARVKVDDSNPGGPGTIWVWLAASDGVATGTEVTAVDNAIDAEHFGGTHSTFASAASTLTVIATVYYVATYSAAVVEAAVDAAIDAYINGAPIGGYDFSPGPTNVIDYNGLVEAMLAVAGVDQVVLSAPVGNTAVAPYDTAVGGPHALTMTPVS